MAIPVRNIPPDRQPVTRGENARADTDWYGFWKDLGDRVRVFGTTEEGGSVVADAPSDGTLYGRDTGTWQPAASSADLASKAEASDLANHILDTANPHAVTAAQVGLGSVSNVAQQPLDATLTALAAYNTNGLITQTGADIFTGRTLTAGTGIVVTFGNGVGGNPTVALAAASPGWTAATGTATRTTFVTSTVTLPVLAEHVKALIDDLIARGLLGP